MIEKILEKFDINTDHALQVRNYAVMIFEAINSVTSEFTGRDLEYLKAAALLHDIGYNIDKKSHHKHSLSLIKNLSIPEYSDYEKLMIANIARYHRNAFPNPEKHADYAALSEKDREKISKLAGMLKIADGLDKPHKNLITGISVKFNDNEIDFFLKTLGFAPKLEMAYEKANLIEFVYNKAVKFICD